MAGEMIERVAKAIAEAPLKQSDTIDQDYATMARAALEAMREPTEEMMKAGLQHYMMQERDGFNKVPFNGRTMFQFMIDEALK